MRALHISNSHKQPQHPPSGSLAAAGPPSGSGGAQGLQGAQTAADTSPQAGGRTSHMSPKGPGKLSISPPYQDGGLNHSSLFSGFNEMSTFPTSPSASTNGSCDLVGQPSPSTKLKDGHRILKGPTASVLQQLSPQPHHQRSLAERLRELTGLAIRAPSAFLAVACIRSGMVTSQSLSKACPWPARI